MQNILIPNVPHNRTARAGRSRSTRLGLQVDVSAFWRGAIACTGTEFCKLAIAETKGFAKWLVAEMEDRLPGFDQQIKLHVTGCTNSCGQHWIADIGLEGKKIKKDGQHGRRLLLLRRRRRRQVRRAPPARSASVPPPKTVPDAIERLLRGYLAVRTDGEDLRAYFARTDDETSAPSSTAPSSPPSNAIPPQSAPAATPRVNRAPKARHIPA